MSERTRSRKTPPKAGGSRRRTATSGPGIKRRTASERAVAARRSQRNEAKEREATAVERSARPQVADEKPGPTTKAGEARKPRRKEPPQGDRPQGTAPPEEDVTPAAMPLAAPLPPAAAIPGTEALADVVFTPGQTLAAMPGLGALAVPTGIAAIGPDRMMRELVDAAQAGVALNFEIMQSVMMVRSPSDLVETQARVARRLSEMWVRQAITMAGMFLAVPSRR